MEVEREEEYREELKKLGEIYEEKKQDVLYQEDGILN
jgi:hypothetical protein